MEFWVIFSILIQFRSIFCQSIGYTDTYGATHNGYPSYSERYVHHMFNLVRIDCYSYRSFGYGRVPTQMCDEDGQPELPMWQHPTISEAARAQCYDLATDCRTLQHNSCDGTSAGDRVRSYFPCNYAGEVGAMGYSYSSVTDGWLCEGSVGSCVDGGHRQAIMSSNKLMVGIGHYSSYIFGDFSNCDSLYDRITHPIYSAIWSGSKFMAVFYHPECSPDQLTGVRGFVRVDGLPYEMTLEYGVRNNGHYIYEHFSDGTEDCSEIYFEFITTAGTFQYPRLGSLYYGSACGTEEAGYVQRHLTVENMVVAYVTLGVLPIVAIIVFGAIIAVIIIWGLFPCLKVCLKNGGKLPKSRKVNKKKIKEIKQPKQKKQQQKKQKMGNSKASAPKQRKNQWFSFKK